MNLTKFVRIFFKDKHLYYTITDKEKEQMFFIFIQCFARLYPLHVQELNIKNIDKVSALDLLFDFCFDKTKTIPYNFYPNFKEKQKKDIIKNKKDIIYYTKTKIK